MRVLIIEDELPTQRLIVSMLKELDTQIEVAKCIGTVNSAVSWLKKNDQPEMILMDIQLSDGLSFEIFDQVDVKSMIVFTTAYDDYMIQSFEVNCIHYLLKPIEKEDLQFAFEKYKLYSQQFISSMNTTIDYGKLNKSLENKTSNFRERFLIQSNESFFYVNIDEIAFFHSTQGITFIVCKNKREFPISISLEKLKEQLPPRQFFKINRQIIINIKVIKRVHTFFQGKLKVETNPTYFNEIIVGKDKAAAFKRWIDQ